MGDHTQTANFTIYLGYRDRNRLAMEIQSQES